jgi:putative isomerase
MAAYVNWSSVVNPSGHLTRPAMLMSKNWMTNVWSWDHCFNAMALVYKNPALAWDQLMLMVDHQDAHGAFPTRSTTRNGLELLQAAHPRLGAALYDERSRWITPSAWRRSTPLCRWTDWWLNCRDDDGDGIPQYHHGNDSGWDNCTAFEVGPPVESADLSAYLVVQMDVLAEVARRTGGKTKLRAGKDGRTPCWSACWRTPGAATASSRRAPATTPSSNRIPCSTFYRSSWASACRRRCEEPGRGLKAPGRFLTDHGLATESVRSPYYQPDGYWRGPIWAPSMMILIDGLAACGEHTWRKTWRAASAIWLPAAAWRRTSTPQRRGPARPGLHLDLQRRWARRRSPPTKERWAA